MWWTLLLSCGLFGKPTEPVPLVLVLSFDTTRADALSCYGAEKLSTPNLDAIAARGVRFEWALSHSPTTLASHTSVFSGLDSHGHAVVANGYPIPTDLPLLTERFKDGGWDTMAIIGASALEQRMGFDRGFRIYDDDVSEEMGPRFEDPADRVTDRALAAVDRRKDGKPLFLFVHYYDAHSPWNNAPAWVRERFTSPDYSGSINGKKRNIETLIKAVRARRADPADIRQARDLYLSELFWSDHELGRLLKGLEQRQLMADSLIVMFADHGETLDEIPQRPYGHGLDVDLVATHVPLILAGTGQFSAVPQGKTVDTMVRLQDLASTVTALTGLGGPVGHGQDLSPLWNGGQLESKPSFAEATKPTNNNPTTWNNLPNERMVAIDGHLLTKTPVRHTPAQLFRLGPEQPRVDDEPTAEHLEALLDAWDARAPAPRHEKMTEETLEALKALGYIDEGG